MSTLLEQASLVMIPSGYKEDIVYSQIPTNGNGDLSFTRASNGTRVNSAGLVEVCPWNMQTYSEDFTNAKYTTNQSSVSANATTAPNGTTTADKIVENTTNDQHFIYFTAQQTAYNETRISVYAKAGGRTNLLMWESAITNAQALFNLSTGVVTSSDSGNAANLSTTIGQIEDAGSGWYRCSFNYSTSSGGGTIRLQLYTTTTSYTGDGTSGVFIWGLQENIGSTAKPYFPTTDRLNVPRLTYQNGGGGCPSLLLEKQSTNLALRSEEYDNATWTKAAVSVTANNITSPDGTQNADLLTTTSASICGAYQLISTGSGTFSFSIFAKKGNNNYLALNAQTSSADNCTAIFDLSDGTLGEYQTKGTTAYVSHKIENFGNDWYRCTMVLTATSNAYFFPMFAPLKTGNTFNASGEVSVASGKTLYLWGCQVEASSYPTSYIPTTSSSATRVADACYKTGISSLFGTNQGTFFIDLLYLNSVTPDYLFDVTDSSNTDRFLMYDSNGSGLFWLYDTISSVIAAYQLTNGQRYKIAVKYNSTATYWYINGVLVATGSNGFAYQMSQIYLGTRFSLSNNVNMQVNESIVFPTALTNAELASLTTI